MRQEFVNAAGHVRGQALQAVLEVGVRIVAAQACRLHQTHHDGDALAGQFATGEQPGTASHGQFRFILPMSGKKLRSSTVGTRCTADACAACTASAAQPVVSNR